MSDQQPDSAPWRMSPEDADRHADAVRDRFLCRVHGEGFSQNEAAVECAVALGIVLRPDQHGPNRCIPVSKASPPENARNFRWAYALLVALAKRHLADANATVDRGGWPNGQGWSGLSGSSKAIALTRARDEAGIPHDDFLAVVRSGAVEVDDLYDGLTASSTPEHEARLPAPAPHDVPLTETPEEVEARRQREWAAFLEYWPMKPPKDTPDPNLTVLMRDMAWGGWQGRAGLPPPQDAGFTIEVEGNSYHVQISSLENEA